MAARDKAWIRHLAENGYVVVGDVVSRAAAQSAAEVLCTRALCDAFISPDLYSPEAVKAVIMHARGVYEFEGGIAGGGLPGGARI